MDLEGARQIPHLSDQFKALLMPILFYKQKCHFLLEQDAFSWRANKRIHRLREISADGSHNSIQFLRKGVCFDNLMLPYNNFDRPNNIPNPCLICVTLIQYTEEDVGLLLCQFSFTQLVFPLIFLSIYLGKKLKKEIIYH